LRDHKKKFGEYPKEFTADKNYYGGPEHLEKWKSLYQCTRLVKKGRRDEGRNLNENIAHYSDCCKSSEQVAKDPISVLKRVFGLYRCLFHGF